MPRKYAPSGSDGEPSEELLRTLMLALSCLDPDCLRIDWFRIGCAVHTITGGSQEGFEVFDSWSRTSQEGKYPGERRMRYEWESISRGPGKVGFGTLKYFLKQEGYMWAELMEQARASMRRPMPPSTPGRPAGSPRPPDPHPDSAY